MNMGYWWNDTERIKPKYGANICPSATIFSTDPTHTLAPDETQTSIVKGLRDSGFVNYTAPLFIVGLI
jgi:hypothetical protein